jgi:hypothetical protein
MMSEVLRWDLERKNYAPVTNPLGPIGLTLVAATFGPILLMIMYPIFLATRKDFLKAQAEDTQRWDQIRSALDTV